MEAELRTAVRESLELFLYPNATFLAGELFQQFRTLENLELLGRAHLRAGDAGTAQALMGHHFPFRDVMPATSSSPLVPASHTATRQTMREGAPFNSPLGQCLYTYGVALAQTGRWSECHSVLSHLEPHAASDYWLGVATQRQMRQPNAVECFQRSVDQNPMMFASLEAAARVSPNAVKNPYKQPLGNSRATSPTQSTTPAATTARRTGPGARAQRNSGGNTSAPATAAPSASTSPTPGGAAAVGGAAAAGGLSHGRIEVFRHLDHCAEATIRLWSYDCGRVRESLQAAAGDRARRWGWGLEMAGLAAFHGGDLPRATQHFAAMLDAEPWRVNREAVVYYSTALWQARADAELGGLAQKLIHQHPHSAYTMAVVGNSYSLGRNATQAYAMLTRATQVDPSFAYAHTLKAHEALALEQRDAAVAHFREAVQRDPRHYNALAGLGEHYVRADQLQLARSYLRQAMAINELPVIINRLAATYHGAGFASETDLRLALSLYQRAIERSPRNFGAMHQRATVLLRLGDVEGALAELETLLQEKSDEAVVFITLGHCHARLGHTTTAVAHYRRAADLDPRRAPAVKAFIERLSANDGQN